MNGSIPTGVLSVKEIPIKDLDDETLEEFFKNDPGWVMEHRPDFVQRCHPESIQ